MQIKALHVIASYSLKDDAGTKKDYEAFAGKYPMNGELKQQDAKIEAMHAWCDEIKIAFTPTHFINRHQLPDTYEIKDIQHFLQ